MCDKTTVRGVVTSALMVTTMFTGTAMADFIPPTSLAPGSQYQIIFVTSGTSQAGSKELNYYNSFVTQQAALNPSLPNTTWRAVASAWSGSARTNAPTYDNIPIYNTIGQLVAIGPNGLWSYPHTALVAYDENGTYKTTRVWTGTDTNGQANQWYSLGNIYGNNSSIAGDDTSLGGTWINSTGAARTSLYSLYALSSLIIVSTSEPATLVWNGGPTGIWDVNTTANFSGSASGKFNDGDHVRFNNAGGSMSIEIAAGGVAPGSLVFANTSGNDYSLSGGPIQGATGLTISSGGHVTLSDANTYTGATTVSAGTLSLTGSAQNTSGVTVATDGALELSNSTASALAATTPIANDGALSVTTAGQEVGTISGSGSTSVSGSLMADSIVQGTLTIGAGGSVTIRETTGATTNAVPEPSTFVLLGMAAVGLLTYAWRRRKRTIHCAALGAAVLVALAAGVAQAVNIETVPVGNARNTGEWSGESYGGFGPDRICGAVDYAYNIGKYEVSAGQYTEFLNKVAGVDTYSLYNTNMWSNAYGCKIERYTGSGTSADPYQYRVASDYANRPANWVNFWNACRFANWLHNKQPSGTQNPSTTEDGAYTLTADGMVNNTITRNTATAKWAVTSEDEWYKAAYHKNDGVTGNYWDYATKTDSISTAMANYNNSVGHTTNVGSYASVSPYGTFDQSGNLWEWTEEQIGDIHRGLRGGSFYENNAVDLRSANRGYAGPSGDGYLSIGFRVSEVPEPSAFVLLGIGVLGLLSYAWRRRKATA
jgi:formylglycine-generating enzyme